jgi:hypothetical protein
MLALLFGPLLGTVCSYGPALESLIPRPTPVWTLSLEPAPAREAGRSPGPLELAFDVAPERTTSTHAIPPTGPLFGGQVQAPGSSADALDPFSAQLVWSVGRSWSLRIEAGNDPLLSLSSSHEPDDERLFVGIGLRRSW